MESLIYESGFLSNFWFSLDKSRISSNISDDEADSISWFSESDIVSVFILFNSVSNVGYQTSNDFSKRSEEIPLSAQAVFKVIISFFISCRVPHIIRFISWHCYFSMLHLCGISNFNVYHWNWKIQYFN